MWTSGTGGAESSFSCACRGIRTCKLCEENHLMVEPPSITGNHTLLTFCVKCSNAFICGVQDGTDCDNHANGYRLHGIEVLNDFISEEEELALIQKIDESPWVPSQSGRNKQDFGAKVNFKKQKISLENFTGLPEYSRFLVERLQQYMSKNAPESQFFFPVELCNLEYLPARGASIVPHIDDTWLWGERLILLNLASPTLLSFTLPQSGHGVNEELEIYKAFATFHLAPSKADLPPCISLPLLRRTLLIMSGKARYTWLHSINRRNISERRLSLTMRELNDEYLPPLAAIKHLAVYPMGAERNLVSEETHTIHLSSKQEIGLEMLKIANSFTGICVAVKSAEGGRPRR